MLPNVVRHLRLCGWAFVATILILASPARADGVMNAVSYFPIPPGSAFEVRTLDNSASNLELVDAMEQALRLSGRGVQDDATLVLTVEPTDQIGSYDGSNRHIMSFTGESSTGHEDDTELRFNLYDSQSGGILNEGGEAAAGVRHSEYALLVRLEDRTNGRQLWEGWASADLVSGDHNALLQKMVAPLANAIGETVIQQIFAIR